MPCQSDYLAQSGQELESIRVCELILYIFACYGKDCPKWINETACNYYGNVSRLDEATTILCALCREMSEQEKTKFMYDGRNECARKLASWFERHEAWDNRRVAEENEAIKTATTRTRALKKLTVEEMKALGLVG